MVRSAQTVTYAEPSGHERVPSLAARPVSDYDSRAGSGVTRRQSVMFNSAQGYDFDWLVIGSGFGGSVSALRLSEKVHSVGVLECGRRFADGELPKSTADLKRYFYDPRLGMKGIFRLTTFRDVSVVSGCGVGGGSLGYANTLYVPPKPFFEDRQWARHAGLGERARARTTPKRSACSASSQNPHDDPADQLLRELGEELGVGDTYKKTPVGVYFGEPGKTVPDPFFGGEGPDRTGCRCAGAAWSAAHTARRTRSSRTTCGSPRSAARR